VGCGLADPGPEGDGARRRPVVHLGGHPRLPDAGPGALAALAGPHVLTGVRPLVTAGVSAASSTTPRSRRTRTRSRGSPRSSSTAATTSRAPGHRLGPAPGMAGQPPRRPRRRRTRRHRHDPGPHRRSQPVPRRPLVTLSRRRRARSRHPLRWSDGRADSPGPTAAEARCSATSRMGDPQTGTVLHPFDGIGKPEPLRHAFAWPDHDASATG
jgi:hypothetical protein